MSIIDIFGGSKKQNNNNEFSSVVEDMNNNEKAENIAESDENALIEEEQNNKPKNNEDNLFQEIKVLMESLQNSLDSNEIVSRKIVKSNTKIEDEISGIKSIVEKEKNEEILELKRQLNTMKNKEKSMLKNIMHIVDQFDYIENYAEESENIQLIENLNFVNKAVKKELSEIGLEEIPALGEQFTPEFHSCERTVIDSTRKKEEIVKVIQKGYKRNGEVIRTAKVVAVIETEENKLL